MAAFLQESPAPPAPATARPREGYRNDIQALRGIAVLLVLVHHLTPSVLPAGFLGVDIFFVISGYLVTRLISASMARGDFSLLAFWAARARRLLPASYTVLLATLIAGILLFDKAGLTALVHQMLGALTFTINFMLAKDSDYFAPDAKFDPLLHMWSLSVEEQFYLILPMALMLLPRRMVLPGAVLLAAASLALILKPGWLFSTAAHYYLLPARAWQLGLGVVAALLMMRAPSGRHNWLSWSALAILIVVPAVPIGEVDLLVGIHPGINAIIICAATLTILLCGLPFLERTRWAAPLVRVGDMSYALYLVHWPLIAIVHNATFGAPLSLPAKAALAGGSLLLAWLLHRGIERPIHRAHGLRPLPVLAAALGGAVLLAGLGWIALVTARPAPAAFTLTEAQFAGFGMHCNSVPDYRPDPRCRSAGRPTLLIWGDSHAMHLVPGLAATVPGGVIQATRGICGPALGIAPVAGRSNHERARGCIRFNDAVLAAVRRNPDIRTVALAASFRQYTDGRMHRLLVAGPHGFNEQAADVDRAVVAMSATVAALRKAGKRVVVIASAPRGRHDVGLCLERLSAGTILFFGPPGCRIAPGDNRREQRANAAFLDRLSRQADVAIIDPADLLCDKTGCAVTLDGVGLYHDVGHLSRAGSIAIARRMGLAQRIAAQAR